MECENYRGIALLNKAYYIRTKYLKYKVILKIEEKLVEFQCGFRRRRSVVEQKYALKELQTESHVDNKKTHVILIDFRQVYDRIRKIKFYKAFRDL